METIAVYPVRSAPDWHLAELEATFEEAGFTVDRGEAFDLAARRGLDRLFVGVGPHREGLVARWKAKSLVPGRARRIHDQAAQIVRDVLGEPLHHVEPREAPR